MPKFTCDVVDPSTGHVHAEIIEEKDLSSALAALKGRNLIVRGVFENADGRAPTAESLRHEFVSREALLEQRLTKDLDAREDAPQRRSQWMFGIAFAVAGGIGLTVVNLLINNRVDSTVRDEITAAEARIRPGIDTAVTSALDRRIGEIRAEALLAQLMVQYAKLETREGFTNAEKIAVKSTIQDLVAVDSMHVRPQFVVGVEKVLDAFLGAGVDADIDQLLVILPERVLQDKGIAQSVASFTGRQLLGDLDEPYPATDLVSKFERAESNAIVAGYPEAALSWRIMHELRCAGFARSEVVDRHVARTRSLQPGEIAKTLGNMVMRCQPQFWASGEHTKDPDVLLISKAARTVLEAYDSELMEIYKMHPEEIRTVLLRDMATIGSNDNRSGLYEFALDLVRRWDKEEQTSGDGA